MTERPILFSAPMVRALLAGTKTQTRRKLKSPWRDVPIQNLNEHGAGAGDYTGRLNDPRSWGWPFMEEGSDMPLDCWPELWGYKIGDRLWARETHAFVGSCDPGIFITRADYPNCVPRHVENIPPEDDVKWTPSIFMPRRFSRLTLTVTDVRVQRLQDISEADACAEGWPSDETDPVSWYAKLWNTINGDESWDANPWVVALSFDCRKGNVDG